MTKKQGNELATVKVYLNTGIIATLVGVGFILSTLIFGVLFIALKQKKYSVINLKKNKEYF